MVKDSKKKSIKKLKVKKR